MKLKFHMVDMYKEIEVSFEKQFERKLQKALDYSRFKERGLKSNPFNIDFSGDPWKVKVGRDEELITGIESLKEMADKNTKMLNILAPHGYGKTTYEILLHSLAIKYNSDLGFEKILFIRNTTEFKQSFVDSSFTADSDGEIIKIPPRLFTELKMTNKPALLFIDDADIIFQDNPKTFTDVTNLNNVLIVAAWNKSAWERAKHIPDVKFPSVEIIMLNRLSNSQCAEMVQKRISEFKMSKRADNLFSQDVTETLARLANGSPHRIIRLAKRLLSYMLDKGLLEIKVSPEFDEFIASADDISYENLKKKMVSLSETQRKIIEEMKKIVEADATKVGTLVGITRVGAMKQLHELEKIGMVVSVTKDKKKIFQLREEIEYGTE